MSDINKNNPDFDHELELIDEEWRGASSSPGNPLISTPSTSISQNPLVVELIIKKPLGKLIPNGLYIIVLANIFLNHYKFHHS